MALGFGSTYGSGTTDKLATALTSQPLPASYAFWAFRHGTGGGGFGRIFEKAYSGTTVEIAINYNGGNIQIQRGRTSSPGSFTFAAPSADAWHHIVVTIDASWNVAAYVDGSSVTVTAGTAGVGGNLSSSNVYNLGNRTDGTRNWDGMLSEFSIWNSVIGAAEIAELSSYISALSVLPSSLVEHIPLISFGNSRLRGPSTKTGTAIQPHTRIFYPGKSRNIFIPGASGPSSYDESLAFSISTGLSDAVKNYILASSSMAVTTGLSDAGNRGLSSAVSMGISAGVSDGSANAVDGSSSIAMTLGVLDDATLAAVGALTIGLNTGLTDGSANALAGALSLGAALGLADSETVAVHAAAAMGLSLGISANNISAIQSALEIAITTGLVTVHGSASIYVDSITLAATMGIANSAIISALGGISLGLGLVVTSISTDSLSGSAVLGVTVGAGANAGAEFVVNIPLSIIAQIQANAAADFGASVALGFTLGSIIAQFVGPIVPPSERILCIGSENRVLSIAREGRIINVKIETRTLNIKTE